MALLDVLSLVLFSVSLLFLGVQVLTLLSNLFFFPVLKPARTGEGGSASGAQVSILVPARNEAHNLPHTLPRLLSQGAAEVIVLDDGSTDATAAVLEGLKAQHASLRVLQGRPLPAGWNGKNWACRQLAGAAAGDVLIFTDADVLWQEATLAALLAFRSRERADYLSVWPRQLTKTLIERLAVPLIDNVLLGGLPYLGVKYSRLSAFCAGNGQLMLFTKEAYRRSGGHEAVRGEVLEDVHLGQRAKATGSRVALALGGAMISARMYRSRDEVLAGFGKNLLAVHLNSPWALRLSLGLNTLAYALPYLFALYQPLWLWLGLLGVMQRALTCLKARRNPVEALLQPFMVYPLWLIGLRALRRKGGYDWKGRSYEA